MAKVYDVWIFEEIDTFWGFSSKQMVSEIEAAKKAGASEIVVHINSPGGSVFEGYAIFNALKSSGLKVTTRIESLCASIATLIALAGESIEMSEMATWMIHNPSAGVQGDAEEMRKNADVLQKVQDQLLSAYLARAEKKGKSSEEVEAAMKAETYLTAHEAEAWGFVDKVTEPLKAAALLKHTNTHMAKDTKGIAAQFTAGIEALRKLVASTGLIEIKAGSMKLRDNDKVLHWEGEEIVQGSTKMFWNAEMTEPASEGDHVLEDGRMVTIGPDGVCVRVMEVDASASAEVIAENERLKTENETLTAKVEQMEKDHLATVTAINAEIKKLQALGIGKEIKAIAAPKPVIGPKGDPKPEATTGLEANFNKFLANRKTFSIK